MTSIYAQGREVDLKIYFPYDESFIDPTYMDNSHNLHIVDSLLSDASFITSLQQIEIIAQSSPEGKIEYNERLSEQRRESLEKYFTTNYPEIEPTLWSFIAVAENWELFIDQLYEDPNIPNREKVLEIALGERITDEKEWLLKKLDDGRSWAYIKENILPSQRFGAKIVFIPTTEPATEPIITVAQTQEQEPIPTPEPKQQVTQPQPLQTTEEEKTLLAIKTNLLLDLITAVNIAVEVPIGNRWSVVGEVLYPWWQSWDNEFTMQIESYHAEVKYWLGNRSREDRLLGWSVGLYGGWGRYDIQLFSPSGVQGDFFDAGAEIGYSHSIAKNLHLEYTVGVGYLSTDYNDYDVVNNTDEYGDIKVIPYPWMNNSLKSVLPTRCGVSLVWTIKGDGR